MWANYGISISKLNWPHLIPDLVFLSHKPHIRVVLIKKKIVQKFEQVFKKSIFMLFFLPFGLPVHVWYILKGKNGKPFLSLKEFHIWVHRIRNLFYRTFFKKGACGGSFCTRMQNINKSIECYDHMLPKNCFVSFFWFCV